MLHLWRREGGETGYAANLQSYRPEALEVWLPPLATCENISI